MKSFAKLVGKLPFAGKLALRPILFLIYQSTTAPTRWLSYVVLMILLGIFVVGHGIQARMGFEALSFEAPVSVKIVYVLYAATNASIAITQVYLGFRVTLFLLGARYVRVSRDYRGYSLAQIAILIVVTVMCQAIFFFCYVRYV